MEKNKYERADGAVLTIDAVEGRMVCLTSHGFSTHYGDQTDLPGAKLPTSADEAAASTYVLAWADDNRPVPYMVPMPNLEGTDHYGFSADPNAPFAATVYLTHPQVQDGMTIPSGANVVLLSDGVFTVSSGSFVYSASLATPGTRLEVNYSGGNAGKLQVKSAGTAVAEVVRFNTTDNKLTFKTL